MNCRWAHGVSRESMVKMFERQLRILITSHKDADVPPSGTFSLSRPGPEDQSLCIICSMMMGAITLPRKTLCTVRWLQYWAWKNITNAHMLALVVIVLFTSTLPIQFYPENPFGEGYGWHWWGCHPRNMRCDDQTIAPVHRGLWPHYYWGKDIRKFPGSANTPLEQYHSAPLLHPKGYGSYHGCAYHWVIIQGMQKSCIFSQRSSVLLQYVYQSSSSLSLQHGCSHCWQWTLRTDMSTYSKEA